MRVFIYNGGLRLVGKSGVGQAILHQREMLRRARIDTADHWCQRAGAVHINTVLPDSVLAALAAKLMGAEGHLLRPLHYGGFPQILSRLGPAGTPLPQVDHLLLQPGRRGADPHGILPPFAGELRPQAARCTAFPTAWIQSSSRRIPPGGRPSAARWGLREGERAVISVGHTIARKGLPEFLELGPAGCRRPVSSGSAGRIPI